MREVKKNILSVGALHWDRRLFDELIPLPDGTSYNAYLVKGSEKTALIDAVDPSKSETLINNLLASGIEKLDYLVAHHGEQDHSGAIEDILLLHPETKVVTNEKCKNVLIELLHIEPDRFLIIEDGQTLSLGDKTLKFIFTPWVHWPETLCTYLIEDKILFSCDFFGSHLAVTDMFVEDNWSVYEPAKRYYAEIMMPFRNVIQKNIEKVSQYEIDMIAPSHGPIYKDPEFIMNAYRDWVSDDVKNEVVLPYVSMHHSTRQHVQHFVAELMELGIRVKPFNLTVTDIGQLAMSLVDAATIVVGCPTVLTGAHPAAANAVFLANALKPKTRFASIIGSYGWGGVMVKQLTGMMPRLKVELIEPVMIKGLATEEDYKKIDKLAEMIAEKHRGLGLLK